jgi:general stress protein YciG
MDPARQREIASKGGRAAHAKGTAHEWSSDEARVAGRKGGEVVSRDRAHMAAIGREGGESRGQRAAQDRERRRQTADQGRFADRESAMAVSRESVGTSREQRSDRGEPRREEGSRRF